MAEHAPEVEHRQHVLDLTWQCSRVHQHGQPVKAVRTEGSSSSTADTSGTARCVSLGSQQCAFQARRSLGLHTVRLGEQILVCMTGPLVLNTTLTVCGLLSTFKHFKSGKCAWTFAQSVHGTMVKGHNMLCSV